MKKKTSKPEVKEYYFSRKLKEISILEERGIAVDNLAIGNPDMPPPDLFGETLAGLCGPEGDHGYQPHRGIPDLRNAFSNWYRRQLDCVIDPESECLPLMGSKEGIGLISEAFLEAGDEVLFPDPGYPVYALSAKQAGARPVPYQLKAEGEWLPDLQELERRSSPATRILWLNYPHMPSGMCPPREKIRPVVDWAFEKGIRVVNDNPYVLNTLYKPFSIFQISSLDQVLELTSLSKAYHLAGWRIGAVSGDPEMIAALEALKSRKDSGMSKAVQLAAARCLREADSWLVKQQKTYEQRRKQVEKLAVVLGCIPQSATSGLFVWAAIPKGFRTAEEMADYLLGKHHLFVAPGTVFGRGGEGFIRISVCADTKTIQKIIHRIQHESHEKNVIFQSDALPG